MCLCGADRVGAATIAAVAAAARSAPSAASELAAPVVAATKTASGKTRPAIYDEVSSAIKPVSSLGRFVSGTGVVAVSVVVVARLLCGEHFAIGGSTPARTILLGIF